MINKSFKGILKMGHTQEQTVMRSAPPYDKQEDQKRIWNTLVQKNLSVHGAMKSQMPVNLIDNEEQNECNTVKI